VAAGGVAMNRKHQQFASEYLKNLNATRAYMKVYPAASYETARRNGSELLTNTDIAQEVKRRLDENAMTADEVLARLAEYGRAEYSPYITSDGSVNIAKLIEDDKGHLIKSVKETEHGRMYEFYDAYAAVVQIGKYHKMFVERTEVTGKDGDAIAVRYIDYRNGIDSTET
jgi:phage terminase small subunit